MQESVQREVVLFTPNKKYTGKIDLQNEDMRTIDQLNSATIYWKDPNEKSFSDAVLLNDVEVSLHGHGKIISFDRLQLRLSDIVFFSDKLSTSGVETEKMRAKILTEKAQEQASQVRIITEMRGDSFFIVIGTFHGLFKNKTKNRFLPLTGAKIYEVLRTGDNWTRVEVDAGNNFIGLSSGHIESCSFSAST